MTTQDESADGETASLLGMAVQGLQRGDLPQAAHWCREVLARAPGHADAHGLLAVVAARHGDFAEAATHFAASLQAHPDQPAAHNNFGVTLRKLARDAEAEPHFRQAIALAPDYAEAHFNLANLLRDLRQPTLALAGYEQALALQPVFAPAYNGKGAALADLQRHSEALECFATAIALQPAFADAMSNQSQALLALGRAEEAWKAAEEALAHEPRHAPAHVNRGNALARMRRLADALEGYERALALDPRHAAAHANRGAALLEANRFDEAIASLDAALAIDPTLLDALDNRAQAAGKAKRHEEAARDYTRLRELAPDWPAVTGNLLHARMLCCDWTDHEALVHEVREGLREGRFVAEPFGWQGLSKSEEELRRCAEIFAAREWPQVGTGPHPSPPPVPPEREGAKQAKITLGYVCGEFRQHATTMLLCGVWEKHDRQRFRLVAFDNGGSDGSAYRQRIEAAFDEIVDLTKLSDDEAAEAVRRRGVDILVNLNGYYGEGRMGLFARRPCAIQVNYLGFPGTLGAPYFDYLVADDVVIPRASRAHYVEQIATLPDCYQANDDRREIGPPPGPRAGHGLPSDGFVFCCFNNAYKITPRRFASWMAILRRVPGSVLWLLEDHPGAARRLREAAAAQRIEPQRIVFAPRAAPAAHLARHALADLFLDTLPYNAHTTASDALWAGLPLLTQRGTTFPGRVAASLLHALRLDDTLVVETEAGYEERAVALALDRPRLQALRSRLQAHRLSPPFDTARCTEHLEALFVAMIVRKDRGLPPGHLPAADPRA